MRFDAVASDRLEGAVADVKRDLDPLDPLRRQRVEQGTREVQAGGGCRHRAGCRRVDGLIPLAIVAGVRPLDVRRQRDVADRVDRRLDRRAGCRAQPNDAPPEEAALDHFTLQRGAFPLEPDLRAGAQLLSRVHQRVPQLAGRIAVHVPEQQAFDRSARGHATAEQPGGNHAGVVDDQQVARAQVTGQRGDDAVLDRIPGSAEHHQPRRAARGSRLRDQFVGQIEIELGDAHGKDASTALQSRPTHA